VKSPSMRRALVVIGPVLGLLAVASCGGGSSNANTNAGAGKGTVADPTKPVTITFESWVGQDPTMKKLAASFHKLHPTITIKFLNSTADAASQKLTTQIAGGEPPDTAYINASDTSDFGSRGALVNLDNYMSRSKIVHASDYVPAFKTFVTYNNHFYGLPFDGESTGLFYRTDLFKAAGITKPPTTWAQFKADAQKLTIPAKKQYGFAEFTQEAAYYWYPWLYQAGGDLLSKDGKSVVFDSPQAKTAANFYVGLAKYSPPNLNSNSYDGRTEFANGQAAMYIAGSWLAGTLTSEFPKINGKWATAPLPSGTAGCKTTIAGDSLVILSGTKNADAAWKWIEYLSTSKNLALWNYGGTGTELPPTKSLLDSPALAKAKPDLVGFAKLMSCGVASTVSQPKFPQIETILNTELGKAMVGQETASQALDNAAQQAKGILAGH
jgi:multiple sugar transport system substrate-binding protein